ncbi:restriction endonuclease subunit S [Rheinheimera sp. FR7-31]|uniref:restriction endonuclease subunit S n=1 Tax=Rheinheimera fenheensis TaxID=3152295 RepID=UPI00325C498F
MIQVQLSEVADIIRGVSFSKDEVESTKSEGLLPVIRAGSIQETLLLNEGQVWVPKEKIRKQQKIRRDDIVMCTSSGSPDLVGKCAKSDIDFEGSFGAFCAGIRPNKEKVSASYLFHFLSSPEFRNWTKSSSGANIKNIRISELSAFEITLPPLAEQKRIAAILDKADAIRRKRQQAIQLADDFLRAVFLEMFGDPVTNPKGWEVMSCSDASEQITVGVVVKPASYYVDQGIPAIRSLNIKDNGIDDSNFVFFSKEDNETLLAKSRVYENDLVLVRSGQPGKAAVIPKNLDGINAIDVLIFRPKKVLFESNYLAYFFNSGAGKRIVLSEERGQVQKHLNVGSLNNSMIPVPPKNLQLEFVSILKSVRERFSSENSVNHFELFITLSQRAFSGKL